MVAQSLSQTVEAPFVSFSAPDLLSVVLTLSVGHCCEKENNLKVLFLDSVFIEGEAG